MSRRPTSSGWQLHPAQRVPRSVRSSRGVIMAKIYIPATGECELLDDIDFIAEARTIRFILEGVHYELDLSEANLQKLRDSLQPFIRFSHVVRREDLRPETS